MAFIKFPEYWVRASTLSRVLVLTVGISMSACLPVSVQGSNSATVSTGTDIITRINVFTPIEGKQQEAIALLQTGLNSEMSLQPGFISATVHRSLDSDNVVVYAQWASQQEFEAAVQVRLSGGASNMDKVFSVAQPNSHPYSVVSVHKPKSDR